MSQFERPVISLPFVSWVSKRWIAPLYRINLSMTNGEKEEKEKGVANHFFR
jgi:hypothetical protein